MAKQLIVETKDLTKKYGTFTAVDKLNLTVEAEQIFGFLGPNGAGKTTTILMLLGLSEPTSGQARVAGFDPAREPLKVKRIAGYLPEKVGFYEDLTARQNLKYTAELNDLPSKQAAVKIGESLALVGLSQMADQKVSKMSRGMKQRLGIADVLLKQPKLVFLDEPTAGIDPEGITQILSLIERMAKESHISLIISSHQLPQMQKICTHLGIISKGHLVAQGSVAELGRKAFASGRFRIELQISELRDNLVEALRRIPGVKEIQRSKDLLLISCDQDLRTQIAKTVMDNSSLVLEMKMQTYSLEDIYLKYFHED